MPIVTVRPLILMDLVNLYAVIPTIITQIAKGSKTIKLGSTSPTRDFNFVKDTVNGFVSAMNSSNCIGSVVNIGSNFEISIKDTVQLVTEVMNQDIDIVEDEVRLRPLIQKLTLMG